MHFWLWMNCNSGALQSLAAIVSLLLTITTIMVLIVTWRAIRKQAEEARALTDAANEQIGVLRAQTMEITNQAYSAQAMSKETARANELTEESNRLLQVQLLSEMRPILVYSLAADVGGVLNTPAVKNVGRGVAVNAKVGLGLAGDAVSVQYLPNRSVIGAGDELVIPQLWNTVKNQGITISYNSLDGRKFSTTMRLVQGSVKQDFAEYGPDGVVIEP